MFLCATVRRNADSGIIFGYLFLTYCFHSPISLFLLFTSLLPLDIFLPSSSWKWSENIRSNCIYHIRETKKINFSLERFEWNLLPKLKFILRAVFCWSSFVEIGYFWPALFDDRYWEQQFSIWTETSADRPLFHCLGADGKSTSVEFRWIIHSGVAIVAAAFYGRAWIVLFISMKQHSCSPSLCGKSSHCSNRTEHKPSITHSIRHTMTRDYTLRFECHFYGCIHIV